MSNVFETLALVRLQHLIGWVGVLVTIGAAAMAASYFRRSRWIAAIAAGFALLALNGIAGQIVIPVIMRRNSPDATMQLGRASLEMSVLGLIALVTLVVGVVGTLSELSHAKVVREP